MSRPKPPLGLGKLKCEPNLSLLLRGPPVPPVLASLTVRLWSDWRAAPDARARGDDLTGVAVAAVVIQQLGPSNIGVAGRED